MSVVLVELLWRAMHEEEKEEFEEEEEPRLMCIACTEFFCRDFEGDSFERIL